MRGLLIVAAVVAVGFVIDRLALAAERRGWIYWRRREGTGSMASGVLGAMDQLVHPSRRSAQEELESREIRSEESPLSAPPLDRDGERPVVRIRLPRS